MKKIITITGKPGSGKGTVSEELSKRLSYELFSFGNRFRQAGLDRGLNVVETNIKAETDPSIDSDTDKKAREAGEKENVILESRLAFHWVPDSFKVYLDLDIDTSAQRMFDDLRNNANRKASEDFVSPEKMKEKLVERYTSEKKRYLGLYNVDTTDLSVFNLVVNTKSNPPETVVEIILEEYEKWLKG